MSCVEVMYQPYSPYFSYQRSASSCTSAGMTAAAGLGPRPLALTATPPQPAPDFKKFGVPKMHEPLEHPASEFPLGRGTADCTVSRSPGGLTKEQDKNAADAQYLSANCIVFTYYTGDISTVVDEHFSRALSHPSSYGTSSEKGHTKDGPPMSHRNFPPSFWNSDYQPSSTAGVSGLGAHPELAYSTDPYHSGTLHASIHQNDPWHYALPSHAQTSNHYPHRPSVHDLSYTGMSSVAASSRFSPQYGSLLLQPSVRSTRLASAACASLEKTTDTWGAARYPEPLTHTIGHVEANYGSPYGTMAAMTGLEGQVQETSKDLYWF